MSYLIFETPPDNFSASIEAAGCYCKFEEKLLFLKRHPKKSQGNTWAIPGGKLNKNETAIKAAIRETLEETGIYIKNLIPVGTHYIRLPHTEYIFHSFYTKLASLPSIHLALEENIDAKWVTIEEAYLLPLVTGGKEALEKYQQIAGQGKV